MVELAPDSHPQAEEQNFLYKWMKWMNLGKCLRAFSMLCIHVDVCTPQNSGVYNMKGNCMDFFLPTASVYSRGAIEPS